MQGRCDNTGRQLAPHVHRNACSILFQEDLLAVQPPVDGGRLLLSQLHLRQEPLEAMAPVDRADGIFANGTALFLTDVVLESAASAAPNSARALDLQRQRSLAMHGAHPVLWGCGTALPCETLPRMRTQEKHACVTCVSALHSRRIRPDVAGLGSRATPACMHARLWAIIVMWA